MIEVADVFRRFAADYLSAHGASMPPSHRRAIADILDCRTAALGGHLWRCDHVQRRGVLATIPAATGAAPSATPNRPGPGSRQRQAEMLPVPYFHVTITVPEELRDVLRANQRDGYGVLMKAAAEAIIELARDPRYVGGTVGVLAVLHTWTQQLLFHPHVHCLVTGGGISEDGAPGIRRATPSWCRSRRWPSWCAASSGPCSQKRCPDLVLPDAVWRKPWVVHFTAWGDGRAGRARLPRPLRLPRRPHQRRIVGLDDETVTLRYKRPEGRPTADLPDPGARVHAPLPPARPAQGLPQGPLLRPVASLPAQPDDPRASRPAARPPHRTAAPSRTTGCPRSSAIARAWFGNTITTARASMPPVPDRPPRRHRPMDPDAPKGAIAPGPASKPPETGAGASTTGRRRGSTRPRSRICA